MTFLRSGQVHTTMMRTLLRYQLKKKTGDILNTSRKATFTFPEGIEVAEANFEKNSNVKISHVKLTKTL